MERTFPQEGLYAALALEDESLRSVVVEVSNGRLRPDQWKRTPLTFPLRDKDLSPKRQGLAMRLAQRNIWNIIPDFIKSRGEKFKAVGISFPGIINTQTKVMVDVPRTRWKTVENVASLINFRSIAEGLVENCQTDLIVDNDAAMSALGERWAWQQERDLQNFAYVRAGVGINGAIFRNGRPWRGDIHPEIGHIFVRPHAEDVTLSNKASKDVLCPVHGDNCLEGRAGSERIRFLELNMRDDKRVEDIFCYYMAQLVHHIHLFSSPPEVILSGPTITSGENKRNRESILDGIKNHFFLIKGNYPRRPLVSERDSYLKLGKLRASEASLRGAMYAALLSKPGAVSRSTGERR